MQSDRKTDKLSLDMKVLVGYFLGSRKNNYAVEAAKLAGQPSGRLVSIYGSCAIQQLDSQYGGADL